MEFGKTKTKNVLLRRQSPQ